MNVAIVQYGTGNTYSLEVCMRRLGVQPIVTDNHEVIRAADKVILPGVGAAVTAMNSLGEKGLDKLLTTLTQPVLGICLGMQLMCSRSQEGDVACLGIFDEPVKKFKGDIKVPHMGWNNIEQFKSGLFNDIDENEFMYFVHSYFVPISSNTIAMADYNGKYSAALQKDNFYGVQFHPEKSAEAGTKIIHNFLQL